MSEEPIYDPPIEHDPIGQALLTLPLAVEEIVGDVAEWAVTEAIIPAAESLIEPFKEPQYPIPNIEVPASEEITGRSSSAARDDVP